MNLSARARCDGTKYTRNIKAASCLDAFNTIPADTQELSVGRREDGDFAIPLPYRWISCAYFAVVLPELGHVSSLDMLTCGSGWTLYLRHRCPGQHSFGFCDYGGSQ